MARDVEKDDLEVNSSRISTSAAETKSNFKIVSMNHNAYKVRMSCL